MHYVPVQRFGKNKPEQDVREELEILGIPVQSVLQLRSQLRDPDPEKDRFPTERPLVPSFTSVVG